MFFNIYNPFAMFCKSTTFVLPNLIYIAITAIRLSLSHTILRGGIRFGDRDIDSRFSVIQLLMPNQMSKTTAKTSALVRLHAWLNSENQICSAICEERVTNHEMLGAFSAVIAFFFLPLMCGIPSILLLLTSSKILNK